MELVVHIGETCAGHEHVGRWNINRFFHQELDTAIKSYLLSHSVMIRTLDSDSGRLGLTPSGIFLLLSYGVTTSTLGFDPGGLGLIPSRIFEIMSGSITDNAANC